MIWFLTGRYADREYVNRMRMLQYSLLRQIGCTVACSQRLRQFRPRNFFLCFQRALNGQEDSMIKFNSKTTEVAPYLNLERLNEKGFPLDGDNESAPKEPCSKNTVNHIYAIRLFFRIK